MPRTTNPQGRPKAKAPLRKKIAIKPAPPRSPSLSPRSSNSEADVEEDEIHEATSTEEGLRFAGYLSPELKEMDSTAQKWCTCGIDPSKQVDMEIMIRCDHRACDPGWYHLSCVQLTEQPPRHLSWFCPTCSAKDWAPEHRNGVCNLSKRGFEQVQIWWKEEKARRASKVLKRREIMDKLNKAVNMRSKKEVEMSTEIIEQDGLSEMRF